MKKNYFLSALLMAFMLCFAPRASAIVKLTSTGDTILDISQFSDTTKVLLYHAQTDRQGWVYDVGGKVIFTTVAPTYGTNGAMKFVFTLYRKGTGANATYTIQSNTGKYFGTLLKSTAFSTVATPNQYVISQTGTDQHFNAEGKVSTWVLHDNGSGLYLNGAGLVGNEGMVVGWTTPSKGSQYYIIKANVQEFDEMTLADLTELYNSYKTLTYPIDQTHPGYYRPATVAPFYEAMAIADSVVNKTKTVTSEELTALYKNLKAQKAALDVAPVNPITEGYYRIRNANAAFYKTQAAYKAMGSVFSFADLIWANVNMTSQYWIFYLKKEGTDQWSIQNFGTGKYVGSQSTLNGHIPMVSTPVIHSLVSLGQGQYNVADPGGYAYHTQDHKSGAGTWGYVIAYNGGVNSFSAWYLDPVNDDALINSLKPTVKQAQLNNAYTALFTEAANKYSTVFYYDKLINDSTQFSSNYKEPTEGSYKALLDNDLSTYFESARTVASTAKHYLQVDLNDKPISSFYLRYGKYSGNNKNRPTGITIFASNDNAKWDSITVLTSDLPTASTSSVFSSGSIKLGDTYRYIRFQVDSTNTGETETYSAGYPYFTFGEFQLYSTTPDPEKSLYTRMGTTVADLAAALTHAQTILTASSPQTTQEDYDGLKTAYDKFLAAYIDTTTLYSEIIASRNLISGAAEGTGIGQFKAADIATFQAAIAKAQSYNLSTITIEDLYAAQKALQAAEKAFKAAAVTITPNKWYYIVNREYATAESGKSRYQQGMYASTGDATSAIKWGGYNPALSEDLTDSAKTVPTMIWRFVPMSDSTYAVQNFGSSYYIGAGSTTAGASFTMSAEKAPFSVEYVGNGSFVIVNNKSAMPLHAQLANAIIVGWKSGIGSASSWTFEDASALNTISIKSKMNSIQAFCFPFAVDNSGLLNETSVSLYEICGKVTNASSQVTALKLKKVETVTAGTPFIMQAGDYTQYDATTSTAISLLFGLNNMTIAEAPGTYSGLIGNFSSQNVMKSGMGYIQDSKLLPTVSSITVIPANSAIIDQNQCNQECSATDVLTLSVSNNGTLTGLSSATISTNAPADVYRIDGVKVAKNVKSADALKSLQKGIYIIGRKKVIVR